MVLRSLNLSMSRFISASEVMEALIIELLTKALYSGRPSTSGSISLLIFIDSPFSSYSALACNSVYCCCRVRYFSFRTGSSS